MRPCGGDGCCTCSRASAHPTCPCITAGRPRIKAGRPAVSQTLPFRPHKRLRAGAALALSPALTGHSCRHDRTEGRRSSGGQSVAGARLANQAQQTPEQTQTPDGTHAMQQKSRAPAPGRLLAPLPAQNSAFSAACLWCTRLPNQAHRKPDRKCRAVKKHVKLQKCRSHLPRKSTCAAPSSGPLRTA